MVQALHHNGAAVPHVLVLAGHVLVRVLTHARLGTGLTATWRRRRREVRRRIAGRGRRVHRVQVVVVVSNCNRGEKVVLFIVRELVWVNTA